ncbi:YaaR family protein [Sporolactobacillus vineae]|uniref:YaaR family protein n=1 Tax=Sporolactobacillus vineae TaxID=444463 RepID=UPI0002897E20|nr:YaaR family protein [Sporolactobacillus vineae]
MAIKISRESGIRETPVKHGQTAANPPMSFERTLAERREAADADVLRALLGKVDDQAERIAAIRTIHEVQAYKKCVQAFLEEAVRSGLKTEQSRSWQRGGARQTLVRTINQKLIQLTNDLLDRNRNELDLLQRLDEIRGLLINLSI